MNKEHLTTFNHKRKSVGGGRKVKAPRTNIEMGYKEEGKSKGVNYGDNHKG